MRTFLGEHLFSKIRFGVWVRYCIAGALLAAFFIGLILAITKLPQSRWNGTVLDGEWQYSQGDSPRDTSGNLVWQNEAWDSAHWKKQNGTPTFFGQGLSNVWMRTQLPATILREPTVFLEEGLQAFEAFLDGQKIYSFGVVADGGDGRVAGNGYHFIPLGQNFSGKILSFRFYSQDINIGIAGVPRLGERSELLLDVFQKSWLVLFFFALTLALGIFSLLLARGGGGWRLYWDMGILSMCLGGYTLLSTRIAHRILGDSTALIHAEQFLEILVPAFMLSYVYELWGEGKKNVLYWARRYFAAYAIAYLLFIGTGILEIKSFILISWMSIVGVFLLLIGAVWEAFRARKPFVVAFAVSGFLGGGGACIEILAISKTIPVGVGSFFVGVFGMYMGLAYIVVQRYVESFRRLGALSDKLAKVFEGTKEMAAVHSRIEVILAAVKWIQQEVSLVAKPSVHVWLLEDGGDAVVVPLLKHGEVLGESARLPEAGQGRIVQKILQENAYRGAYIDEARTLKIPICWREKTLGLISIAAYSRSSLVPEEADFINTLMGALGLALENAQYLSEVTKKARLESDLILAEFVQRHLLPENINIREAEFMFQCITAEKMGGDWIGSHHDVANERFFFFIGDVTGHGIPSALISAVACGAAYATVSNEMSNDATREDCANSQLIAIATRLNEVVYRTGRNADRVMTMIMACLDLRTGSLNLLNAGHCHPFVLRASSGAVESVLSRGRHLGFAPKLSLEVMHVQLMPGDRVVSYTDGVIEHELANGEALGSRGLKRMIEMGQSEKNIIDWIVRNLGISGDRPASLLVDDVSVLSLKWHGHQVSSSM